MKSRLKALAARLERHPRGRRLLSRVRNHYAAHLPPNPSDMDKAVAAVLALTFVRSLPLPVRKTLSPLRKHVVGGLRLTVRGGAVIATALGLRDATAGLPQAATARYASALSVLARVALGDVARDYGRAAVVPPSCYELLNSSMLDADLAEAEHLLAEAIELAPDFAEAVYTLGLVLRERGDKIGAAAQFLLAAEMPAMLPKFPDDAQLNAKAYCEAGRLLWELGSRGQAETCLRRALDRDGKLLRARFAYARVLAEGGKPRLAARQMALAIAMGTSTDVPAPIELVADP